MDFKSILNEKDSSPVACFHAQACLRLCIEKFVFRLASALAGVLAQCFSSQALQPHRGKWHMLVTSSSSGYKTPLRFRLNQLVFRPSLELPVPMAQ